MRTFMIWTLLAALAPSAWANNNYFLPGDAYFPTELTTSGLKQLQDPKKQEYVFRYSSSEGYEWMLCGTAGYRHALIEEVDGAFIENLGKARDHLRASKVKPRISPTLQNKPEEGEMQVLFVPEAFEITKFKLGLRYNENWTDEVMKFGYGPDHMQLCELLEGAEALETSWRDSRRVGSFELRLPEGEVNPLQAVDAPVTIKGAVKAVVLHPGTLASYFKPQEGDVMRVVDSKGLVTYRLEKWKWVEFESPQP